MDVHPHIDNDAERHRLRWFVYTLLIAISGGLGAASILRVEPLLSANDRSRWCTVRTLVDEGTFQIDAILFEEGWDTIDKVRHEGHFYSSKPALLPLLVAGVYWTVQRLTDAFDGDDSNGWTLKEKPAETTRFILLIVNLLPMLAALFVFALLVERYAVSDFTRIFAVAAASMGTLLTTFLVTLNNHTIAAVCCLFALYPTMRIVIDGERKPALFALAGFFAAFTCTNELPAALFGVASFGLCCWKSPRRTFAFFVPAALIPLGAYFFANYQATGGWKPFYAYYGTEKYRYVFRGIPSYWMNPGGLDANEESAPVYFLHCTFGHHGVFSLSPIFILSLIGWCGVRRWRSFPGKTFLWLGLGLSVAVLGFYLTRTANYNYGGNTSGLRWLFWLIPLWLIAMIPVLDAGSERRWFRGVATLLLGVSVFSAMYSLNNPWKKPWLFALMERWEWIDYSGDPPPQEFEHPPSTWFRTLPTTPPEDPSQGEWVRFEGFDAAGNQLELTLLDVMQYRENGRTIRRIAATWSRNGKAEQPTQYNLDQRAFEAGAKPAEFLLDISRGTHADALTFLRGLPQSRLYRVGKDDYLFTLLQDDAIRCRKAASRVVHRDPFSKRVNTYRCDTWLSDAVPFGVVQFVITVRDRQTGELLAARQMTVVEASSLQKKKP
ncbi:MAG: hypothetical protein IID45_01635 [Planctomycetes bacterium]|nr:hypothetical protein [Planctomycetota bacterium]